MLRTHRAVKGLGGCGGCGLGSRSRRGPGMPPTAGLRGQGTSPGSSAGFLDSSGQGNHLLLLFRSSQRVPPICLSYSPLSLPPMFPGPMWPGGGFGVQGEQAWELTRLPGPSGPGYRPLLLSLSSRRPLPSTSPDLPGLRGSNPVWPPLLLPLQPLTSYWFTLGFLLSPWTSEFPTRGRQMP